MLGTQSMCRDNTERWGDYLCSCVRIVNTPVMCLSEALERDRPTVSCACARGLLCLCACPGSLHLMVWGAHGAVQGILLAPCCAGQLGSLTAAPCQVWSKSMPAAVC